MVFKISLYLSLFIFGLGLIYKISTWFRHDFGPSTGPFSPWQRFWAAVGGMMATVFSGRILILLKTLLLDVFWQRRLLRESPLRWVMHLCLFWGFTLLLLMHALEGLLAAKLTVPPATPVPSGLSWVMGPPWSFGPRP